MSKDYQVNWSAHPNVHNNYSERSYNVYFSEPASGVNSETGLLLLIAGFGGHANSNVYKKMRSKFADQYNLVTIQCDYFGQEFMQSPKFPQPPPPSALQGYFQPAEIAKIYKNGFDSSTFLQILTSKGMNFTTSEILQETIDNFNDMGIMQALDNITAICYVIQILRDNNLTFNSKKVMIYGHSHGAYLGYLCNAFAPNLISHLIDNSSWLIPAYFKEPRSVLVKTGNTHSTINFHYMAAKLPIDEEILYLPLLYKNVKNSCEIHAFHGTTDFLISHTNKRNFCDQVPFSTFHEISAEKVDGIIFKSTNHGLDSDHLALFQHVIDGIHFSHSNDLHITPTKIVTSKMKYHINYDAGIPLLKFSQNWTG